MEPTDDDAPEGEGLDPTVLTVLAFLWDASNEPAPRPASLARLSKQAGVPMSTLRRSLVAMEDAGLLAVSEDDKGRVLATLTDEGRGFCAELFAEGGPGQRAADATSRPTSFSADSVPDDQA